MIEIKKYTAGYSKNQYLFKEISIKVSPGSIIGIKGTNGCGKSTFIKGLINLTPIKKGEIILDELKISNWETSRIFRTKKIGYLSQRERVFNHLTVYEHLRLQHEYSINLKASSTHIYNRLFKVIESKQNCLASILSGGEQLILNLLCLIILNPNTIILDEPSDSLDMKNKEFLSDIFQLWKRENKSIIIVEQDFNFLNKVSDNIINLNNAL